MMSDAEPLRPVESSPLVGDPQNAALLQTVLDSLTYPLYVIDVADYHVSLVNRAAQEWCRVEAATCYALTHRRDTPCHTEEHPCPIEIIKATGRPTVVEHVHYDPDGTPRTVEVHAFPIFDQAHRLVQIIEYCVDITERRQADQALRESEERLAGIVNSAMDGIISVNEQQRIVLFNPAAEKVFGYRAAEMIGQPLGRLIPERFRRAHEEHIRHYAQTGVTTRHMGALGEIRGLRADGEEFPIEASISQITVAGGKLFTVILRDITERRRADEALRESEERLRAIFDNAGIGLAEAADDDRFITVNDRLCQILGYSRDELLGKTVHELTAPQDRATSDVLNAQLHQGRSDRIDYEKRYLRRDGTPVWAHVTVSVIHDAAGRWHRSIATIEDISERKRMEEELRESEAGLAAAQRLAHIGSWQWNIAADTAQWSEETFRMFGLARGPLEQHREDFLSRVVPEDRQRVDQALSDALSGVRDYDLDYRIRLQEGPEKVIHAQARVVRSSAGRPVLMHGTVQDITERKRVEEALRELNATLEIKVAQRTLELEQRARQLQRLTLQLSEAEDQERRRLADILHDDLQQILAAAKFQLGRLRSRAPQDPAPQAITAQIDNLLKEAIEKSRNLSHELSPAVLRHGDLGETLRWLADQVQAKHGLAVQVQVSGRVELRSEALTAFLYRASQETLFNVVKHAGVNEARIRVRRLGRYVGLSVSDEGRGFDPQDLKAAAGFGLLSIRERVGLLGGRMKIKSARGRGSTFLITVPDGEKPARDDRLASTLSFSPAPRPPGPVPLRVLLADDHEIVRHGLISVLSEERGIEVVGQASNGREAVELACRLEPDVVVMDVSMPVMAGEEATRLIKRYLPQTRIIALSMHDEVQVRARMHSAGAAAYLLKTAPSEELLAAIREN